MPLRTREEAILDKSASAGQSAFVAIYGRRRIGKTYFVRHYLEKHADEMIVFQFTGLLRTKSKQQIVYFVRAVKKWLNVAPQTPVQEWSDAFFLLEDALTAAKAREPHRRIVVFIDELPWIAPHKNDSFLPAFAHFWNTFMEEQKDAMLIVCGSATSWMIHNIVQDTGPLYGRVTAKLHMHPFSLYQTRQYLTKEKGFHLDDKTVCDVYMATGGVAKYLSYFDASRSVTQNIHTIFFTLDGGMVGEYDEIMESLFGLDGLHGRILDVLAEHGSLTKSDLAAKLGTSSGGQTDRPLQDLLLSGIISRMDRLHYGNREAHYQVADPFCRFYHQWMRDYSRNALLRLPDNHWDGIYGTATWHIWAGLAFENVCRLHVREYLAARGIAGVDAGAYYWSYRPRKGSSERGAQIDLIIERENNTFDLVECKYANDVYTLTKADVESIRNKVETFKRHGVKTRRFDIKIVLLTTYGAKINTHFNALPVSMSMELEALFRQG